MATVDDPWFSYCATIIRHPITCLKNLWWALESSFGLTRTQSGQIRSVLIFQHGSIPLSSGMQSNNMLEWGVLTWLDAFMTGNGGLIPDCPFILVNKYFQGTYWVPGALLSILQVVTQLIIIKNKSMSSVLCSFVRQKMEAQRVSVIYLRSHRW